MERMAIKRGYLVLASVLLLAVVVNQLYLLQSSYFHKQVRRLTRQIKANPRDVANYIARGEIFADRLYYSRAILDLEKALSLNSQLPTVHNDLGFLYIKKGWYDKAEDRLKKAVALSPYYSKPYFNLALVARHHKNNDQAIEWLSKAIACDRNFIEAYAMRADCYSRAGAYDKALADLRKEKELYPQQSELIDVRIREIEARSRIKGA